MMVSVWTGDAADARGVNEELWRGPSPLHTDVGTTSFVALQSCNDDLLGPGACNYTKGGYLGELTAGCIETLIASAEQLPSALSVVEIGYQHGAQDRFDDADTAFADRHADHLINVLSRWFPDDEARPHVNWARETFDATSRWHSGGVYVNFLAADDDNRVIDAYRGGKYEQLRVIKGKYDPENVFSSNPNVDPAGKHV
jgi:Berberine and berberine like